MSPFNPKNPDFEQRVRESFNQQAVMQTMSMQLESVAPGRVVITMPFSASLTQQHGFLHAGVVSTGMDSACGYAAYSLMPAEAAILSIEFKSNMLRPAQGDHFEFIGEVLKAGKTITVVEGKAYALRAKDKKLIASMTGSMMTVIGRGSKG